jgi:excisionase family DNA binding protein
MAAGLVTDTQKSTRFDLSHMVRSSHPRSESSPSLTPARTVQKLLTVDEAASALNTTPRFVHRLIAERRIAFHHIGRHVSQLAERAPDRLHCVAANTRRCGIA